jgi:transcriptional regulator with XRE-family HTH domain
MKSHLNGDGKKSPYRDFGRRLSALRQKAGIASQSALASLLGCKQQTVNRWEAGLSRPRDKQIPLLASVLQTDVGELTKAAGYGSGATIVTSFDQPFPIDGLTPEGFERFCLYALERIYPDAMVHRVGGPGHAQDGLDIEIMFDNKDRYGFQCKRVDEFGPQKVHAAIGQHFGKTKKSFLLLSRVASPQAREAVKQHPTWDIWDKDDISLRVRQLSKHEQRRLVDVFFPQQRQALLGDTESSPWQTAEEFFAPFVGNEGAFRHTWPLVGRADELRKLSNALVNEKHRVVMLVGSGGTGKTRLLKEMIDSSDWPHRPTTVRFLSPTEEASRKNLEEMGKAEKLLIVDDAHDRTDLPLLFQYTANLSNKTKLLVAARPYGLDYIRSQAGNFALAGNLIETVEVGALTNVQSTGLAKQALEEFKGPIEAAEDLARITLDCPLATVLGAQILAKDGRHVELVKNEESFRTTLLGRFRDIIAGGIGSKADAILVQKLLRVIALIQPFYSEDDSVSKLVEAVEGVLPHDSNRLLRLLIEAGVLFKRGGLFRLSPDLLADHIIENACIGTGGISTGYAERVFDAASNTQIEHILLNLGKLDWRLSNGNPSNSRLLDGIWRKLRPSAEYADPHIRAVTSVAYYQPERALSFAEKLILEGRHLRDLPNLIKYAAYNYEHIRRACECLWEIGKRDDRELGQHPSHSIRILSELCAVEPNKPIMYNEKIVDFGIELLASTSAWNQKYSPFDILNGILNPEGHTTTSSGAAISIGKFNVLPDAVSAIRAKVIDAIVRTLAHPNPKAGMLAARCLQGAFRYPMDAPVELRDKWTAEFLETFGKIESTIRSKSIDPLVLIGIAAAISWHANFGLEETSARAKGILDLLPSSLEFQTLLALKDGYGHLIEKDRDFHEHEKKWNKHLVALTKKLLLTYPDAEALRSFIAGQAAHIKANEPDGDGSPYVLYWQLVNNSTALARQTVENALQQPTSDTAQFVAMSLAKLLHEDRAEGFGYVSRCLGTEARNLHIAAGTAFGVLNPEDYPLVPQELEIIREILSSSDEWVARSAIAAVRTIAKENIKLAIELSKCVDVGISSQLADHVFMTFATSNNEFANGLSGEDADVILSKLLRLPKLDGHWIESFLSMTSKRHARRLAQFFMRRVEYASDNEDWSYRPCNYGPYGHVPLKFRESPEFVTVLREVSEWAKSRKDLIFRECSAQLFDVMFRPFDDLLVSILRDWTDAATEADIQVIAKILSEAHRRFVFEQREFVVHFLTKAQQFGKEVVDRAVSSLFGSAISGLRSGTPGEPFPEDLRMKADSEKLLGELPHFSPAHELYAAIANHSDENIKRAFRDREALAG